ncbi:hypothetical protein [Lachnoclostridium sp. An76]|uniref:hypothetical protein n=1 Tax=Lachnoclostridium sp. An76 TaxID=1965654 RepID=UPI000B386432|nr:hypothetical protein [Lachnoclostridium sp. An76]OUN33066.1 hypothetical protein B5G27_13145 [Lachnoclostridium sp. An76]
MTKKITDQMFDEMDENNMSAKDLLGVVMHLVDTDDNADSIMIGDIRVEGLIRAAYSYILKNDRMFSQK